LSASFKISLKANERIYINGAVLRVDRKTSIEFLNDVNFLIGNHVLQIEQANTPLKQLYYIIQTMLITPNETDFAFDLYKNLLPVLISSISNPNLLTELKDMDRMVHEKDYYEAMKCLRSLFKSEEDILATDPGEHARRLAATGRAMRQIDYESANQTIGAA
jgi:flagellar biosynthesis repressor protein FlbT